MAFQAAAAAAAAAIQAHEVLQGVGPALPYARSKQHSGDVNASL